MSLRSKSIQRMNSKILNVFEPKFSIFTQLQHASYSRILHIMLIFCCKVTLKKATFYTAFFTKKKTDFKIETVRGYHTLVPKGIRYKDYPEKLQRVWNKFGLKLVRNIDSGPQNINSLRRLSGESPETLRRELKKSEHGNMKPHMNLIF